MPLDGTAVGRALKKRWTCFPSSSISTTTTVAPAVYANTREVGRLSKHGGDVTVVPIIFFSDNPDSYGLRALFEERGVLVNGEFEGLNFKPSPVLAAKVLGLTGVEDIIDPPCTGGNWLR
jgi:hypothetical protein